jgi:hypothetical protein
MKAVLILATSFIFISMLMNGARRRGKLNDQANRAVTGLANSMRWFVYGLLFFVGVVCAAVAWQVFQAPH